MNPSAFCSSKWKYGSGIGSVESALQFIDVTFEAPKKVGVCLHDVAEFVIRSMETISL